MRCEAVWDQHLRPRGHSLALAFSPFCFAIWSFRIGSVGSMANFKLDVPRECL